MKSKAAVKNKLVAASPSKSKLKDLMAEVDEQMQWFFKEYGEVPLDRKERKAYGSSINLTLFMLTKTIGSWKRKTKSCSDKEKEQKALSDFFVNLGKFVKLVETAIYTQITVGTLTAILGDMQAYFEETRPKLSRKR